MTTNEVELGLVAKGREAAILIYLFEKYEMEEAVHDSQLSRELNLNYMS